MEIKKDKRIVVQSLIGSNQLHFYLRCLSSLIEFSEDQFDLHLHSDGSLSQKDEDLIHSKLNLTKVTISNSRLNKDNVLDCLSGKPNCQRFRKESIWGIEFFEPLFLDNKDPVSYYLDADILFLQPFSGLFNRSKTENSAIFLKDTQWDAYCLRPLHFIGKNKKPEVVEGINTGLVFWDKCAIDWDYLEWFLGAHHLHHILSGLCLPHKLVWQIDVMPRPFVQSKSQTYIPTQKFQIKHSVHTYTGRTEKSGSKK